MKTGNSRCKDFVSKGRLINYTDYIRCWSVCKNDVELNSEKSTLIHLYINYTCEKGIELSWISMGYQSTDVESTSILCTEMVSSVKVFTGLGFPTSAN